MARPLLLAILFLIAATTAYSSLINDVTGLFNDVVGDVTGLADDLAPQFQTLADYVKTLNYPAETHQITTEDGYILTYFRIQAKEQTYFKTGLPVIYMHHGLLDSADTFVINEEADAPGLQLANQGYDVWFGNSRGNKYCQSHVTLNATDKAFWQFSWQNMSHYDLPAAFQYIHEITGQNITYVGHSQGTLIMFAALSVQEPNVMAYLKKYIALSPVGYVGHQTFGPVVIASLTDVVEEMQNLGINQFMPYEFLTSEAGHLFCKELPKICGDFLGMIYGYDPQYDNFDYYNQILEHEPAGTSIMDMLHWKQLFHTQQLAKYDFGTQGNLLHYNQTTPPLYNLSAITFPMHFFHGSDDPLADPTDYQLLVSALTNCNLTKGEYPADHMTFMWSKNISFYWADMLQALQDPQETLIEY